MRAVKILGILLAVYVGIVVLFESLIGYFQPEGETTLTITTMDGDGGPHERVLSRIENDGQLYVAANHWPRAWYQQALDNPEVLVEMNGDKQPYRAVPVDGDEHDRVNEAQPLGVVVRILTGFPPRYFVRLDPADSGAVRPDPARSSGAGMGASTGWPAAAARTRSVAFRRSGG